jgi:hypothetical protein
LERYREIAIDHYKNKSHQLIFIYLKTGNECLHSLKKITGKGYSTIDRRAVLSVLNKRRIRNEIFNDFKEYLTIIENITNSYTKLENITSEWKAGEGFYIKLQELIDKDTNWGYVANQTGGFLGFWYYWTGTEEIGEIYIQIENAFEYGIKLVIKIADWEPSTEKLYELLAEMKPIAEKNDLMLMKPDRFRPGATSTLGVIQNVFTTDDNGDLEIQQFVKKLNQLEQTLDEYCASKN